MCGVAGFLHTSFSNDKWEKTLLKMAAALVHRGPDDEGIWFDAKAGAGLAHRRLSVIDLSREGHQPMTSASGRYVIAYNGEIYNFHEIRTSLAPESVAWRGTSDTEVMLAAIEVWGLAAAVKRFVGMFVFALWDKKERVLHLCRDRLGIKPLYYTRVPRGVLFGSEFKPLAAHPEFNPEIDRDALALYFRHNCVPAPYSIYRDTRKLLPGSILSIPAAGLDKNQDLPDPSTFWSAREIAEQGQEQPLEISPDHAVDELETLLQDAVKLRLLSDVPLGAFLSGGIDSSTIVALMQAQSSRSVKTFSIGIREKGYNEADHAKAVADHLGTDHTELYVHPDEALAVIPQLPHLYDEPFSDSSQIPTFLLSKLTRQHVTVSLSGDGGDELFGGYNRHFWGRNILKYTGWAPWQVRKWAADCVKRVSPLRWDSFFFSLMPILPDRFKIDMPGDRIHKLSDVVGMKSPEGMYHRLISHWKNPSHIVLAGSEPLTRVTDPQSQADLAEFAHKMMFLDLISYLPDDILTKVDRASMGVSLEARVPMLDHRVVEFAWQLPLSMKIRGNQGKWILRQVLYKYVPKNLVERPKTGFAVPIDAWLRGPLREWAESLLDETSMRSQGFLDPGPIRAKWADHLSGRRNWQYHLWDVLMFQAWMAHQIA